MSFFIARKGFSNLSRISYLSTVLIEQMLEGAVLCLIVASCFLLSYGY